MGFITGWCIYIYIYLTRLLQKMMQISNLRNIVWYIFDQITTENDADFKLTKHCMIDIWPYYYRKWCRFQTYETLYDIYIYLTRLLQKMMQISILRNTVWYTHIYMPRLLQKMMHISNFRNTVWYIYIRQMPGVHCHV